MKLLFRTLLFFCLPCFFFACNQKEEPKVLGSIYGAVKDKASGEPIRNAHVELMPVGLTIDTGDEGQFEFVKVEEGIYNLFVTKNGYKDYKTSDIVVKGNSNGKPVNIQIEKLPPSLRIVDENGKDINQIVFGDEKDDVIRTFNIFNDGESSLSWQITKTVDWIQQIRPDEGSLKLGETQAVIMTIDRALLTGDNNVTTVHVTSNSGSKQISVSATGVMLPAVEVWSVFDIEYESANIAINITNTGIPNLSECGIVISTEQMPTIETAMQNIYRAYDQSGQDRFYYNVDALRPRTQYFVRAYAVNDEGVAYSKEFSFTTAIPTLPYFELALPYHIYEQGMELIGWLDKVGDPKVLHWGFLISSNTEECPSFENCDEGNLYYYSPSGNVNTGHYVKKVTFDMPNEYHSVVAYATTKFDTVYDQYFYVIETFCPYIVIGDLAVALEDEIAFDGLNAQYPMTHYEAKNQCNNLVIGSYDNWRLPTLDELKIMYENRNTIGGFRQTKYWTSTQNKEDPEREDESAWDNGYATLNFSTGETYYSSPYVENYFYVRPVRTIHTSSESNANQAIYTRIRKIKRGI